MKNPEMWTMREFSQTGTLNSLNGKYRTKIRNWDEVFGKGWETNKRNIYELYVNWHIKNFTKLGKALL